MGPTQNAYKPKSSGKRKGGIKALPLSSPSHGTTVIDSTTRTPRPAFPLVAFLWPTRTVTSRWVVLPPLLMAAGLFRWAASLWDYSGYKSPPMHGDFEAQRHWMEITAHLPVSQWYFHDLEWWGLDYPPLTAYHSWVLGKIGSFINPLWFALQASRKLDDPALKVYMRSTVIISEYLIYIPALVVLVSKISRLSGTHVWESSIALTAILLQPSVMLIDHAHFQYNTVMLGLAAFSASHLLAGRRLWASVFFVAALGFKQMALYYAPAIFAYLLGSCIQSNYRFNVIRLISIGLVTLLSFVAVFAPLLLGAIYDNYRGIKPDIIVHLPRTLPAAFGNIPLLSSIWTSSYSQACILQISQAIHRIFPFQRGLFEDKVANFWCATNTLYKLKHLPVPLLQRFSLAATLLAILPPMFLLLFPRNQHRQSPVLLLSALAATSLAFFLFSFQVHEKSILLPLLPITLLLATRKGMTPSFRAWITYANALGVWTMYPLLKRDGLRVPYAVLALMWAYLLDSPPVGWGLYGRESEDGVSIWVKVVHLGTYIPMVLWHVGEAFMQPPAGKPDLWVVLNVLVGAPGFALCYLWTLWICAEAAGWVGGDAAEAKKDGAASGHAKTS